MSVDTPVCETIIRRFDRNEHLQVSLQHGSIEVWSITMDLPFSLRRFREIADVKYVKTMSDFRERSFGSNYGALLSDPFAALLGALRS
jgi:thiol peroxidase